KRGFVLEELKAALKLKQEKHKGDIYLIPVMLEEMRWAELPDEIKDVHWVKYYEVDGWEKLHAALEFAANQRRARLLSLAKNAPSSLAELSPRIFTSRSLPSTDGTSLEEVEIVQIPIPPPDPPPPSPIPVRKPREPFLPKQRSQSPNKRKTSLIAL